MFFVNLSCVLATVVLPGSIFLSEADRITVLLQLLYGGAREDVGS